MASFLIEDQKYAFLKDLGLDKTNKGVYNGQWFGSGEVISLILKFVKVKFAIFVVYKITRVPVHNKGNF